MEVLKLRCVGGRYGGKVYGMWMGEGGPGGVAVIPEELETSRGSRALLQI